jgi:YfiH family protein
MSPAKMDLSMAPRAASPDPIDQLLTQGELASNPRSALRHQRPRETKPEPKAVQPQAQRRVAKSRVEIVRAPALEGQSWLIHGFSTRTGGVTSAYRPGKAGEPGSDLNLGFTQTDTRDNVLENRRRFLKALGAPSSMKLTTLKQIHSSSVLMVGEHDLSAAEPCQGDGLMTNEPGILLAIQTADCIPVLIADVKKKAVAAFHAGWRGTVKRIVESGVGKMRVAFRSRPEDLIAAIGPGIAACCYAVGEEVRIEFGSQFSYAAELFHEVSDLDPVKEKYPMLFLTARAPGHSHLGPSLHLDLMEANRRQLLDAGLRAEAITVVGDCTRCQNNRYFSYRAESGATGRLLSVVGIRG